MQMCAHCYESPAGEEGTIYCTECLSMYRKIYAEPMLDSESKISDQES